MGKDPYRHPSFEEREQIAIWRLEGGSQAEMARRPGRSSSTVNRELARNRLPSSGYQPSFTEGSYLARRERAALLERDEQLERFVIVRLAEGWSPEQIGARRGLLTSALSDREREKPCGSSLLAFDGCQFTSMAFTSVLHREKIAISMDGRGAWRDNVFVERLWRSVKYEEIYLRAYVSVSDARASIGRYLTFYNGRRRGCPGRC